MDVSEVYNESKVSNVWLNPDFFQYVLIENWVDRNFKQNLFSENNIKELLKTRKIFFDDDILKASYLEIEQSNERFKKFMKKNNFNQEIVLNPKNLYSKRSCPTEELIEDNNIKKNASTIKNCLKYVDPIFIFPGKQSKCLICKKGKLLE